MTEAIFINFIWLKFEFKIKNYTRKEKKQASRAGQAINTADPGRVAHSPEYTSPLGRTQLARKKNYRKKGRLATEAQAQEQKRMH